MASNPPNRPRTVLYLSPSSRLLGARRSLLTLAEALEADRWRAVVCAQTHGQLGRALEHRGIPFHVLKLGWWRKGKYILWRPFAISRLAQLARHVQADLIHCNEIYPNPYAVRAVTSVQTPDESPRGHHPIPVVTHVRLGMKPGMIRKYDLERADRIVVPSLAMSHEFDEWSQKRKRVCVIHNGVNMEQFRRIRSREAARSQLGIPCDGPLVACIGQLGPRKAGDVVLEAFARLLPRHPEMRLMFVGDPHRGQEWFAEQIRGRAAASPLDERVHFFTFDEDVLPYYEAADLNVLVSRDEAFGRTIIEAGAVGIASIGSRVGGIAEIIIDGTTGRLVAPENPEELAEAMDQLLSDPALRRRMGEAAFRHIAQHFSVAAHAERIMELYDQLVESPARTE